MPTKTPRASVIIPNWNGLCHLPECLDSLASQSFLDFDVIMVDNASDDDSVRWVRNHHPEVCILQRKDNGGFSKAVNVGIRAAKREYVALLNNDTAVEPQWLGNLIEALDERPDYDFAASKMTLYDKPEVLNAAGDTYSLTRLTGHNRGLRKSASLHGRRQRVLGACAGAALYRRTLFDEVGLFDEDFFLISEDTDFNLRCLIAGKKCLYVPTAKVRHKLRASIETRPSTEMRQLGIRNEALVIAKDMPGLVLLFAPLIFLYQLLRQTLPIRPSRWHLIPVLIRKAPENARAEWEGFRLGLTKRADVWSRKAIGTPQILRWLIRGSGPV